MRKSCMSVHPNLLDAPLFCDLPDSFVISDAITRLEPSTLLRGLRTHILVSKDSLTTCANFISCCDNLPVLSIFAFCCSLGVSVDTYFSLHFLSSAPARASWCQSTITGSSPPPQRPRGIKRRMSAPGDDPDTVPTPLS